MKSKTIVIAMVAALAVSAIAFLGSGDGLGNSIGSIGQKAVDGAIGMFVYTNRSGHGSDAAQPAGEAARLNAAKARAAKTADATSGGAAAGDGSYGHDVIQAATDAAQLAGDGSVGIAERAGQAVEISGEGVSNASASGSADAAASGESAMNPAGGIDVALAGEPIVVETEGGESDLSAPSSMDAVLPGGETPADAQDGAAAEAQGGDGFEESSEDGWADADPFEFEDESVLREMGPGYSRFDGRDPFLALVTTDNQNASASSTVDPDGLRFVGIIWGGNGIRALVEDSLRRGYVLREGDRVLYGRVTSISREVLVIDQVIHGEFKRVSLRLESYSREGN